MGSELSGDDIDALIRAAKIGRERKEAQIETCSVFAAALHDVLQENGCRPSVACVAYRQTSRPWAHCVVEVDGEYYDSMGRFDAEILRKRLKIHPTVAFKLEFAPEPRDDCYDESDYEELYQFLLERLRKAASACIVARAPEQQAVLRA